MTVDHSSRNSSTITQSDAEPNPALAVTDPHLREPDRVAAALGLDPHRGLAEADVAARRERVGFNQLAEPVRRPEILRFLDQFRSVLILVLIGAALLAGVVGDLKDSIVIGVVLLINATIGYLQERRAERSLDALRSMLVPTARVRRDGVTSVVDASQLVPGDLVLLEAGDRVPADARLLLAESVEADESALTGESQPVAKRREEITGTDGDVALAERSNMLFMNTAVTRGRAEAVVTATGMATQVGAIADMLRRGEQPATPLQTQLDSVGRRIALIGGLAVSLYALLALLQGESLADLAIRAVALAVAAVPEGLPAVLALTLALGVYRMAQRGAIVKRLASVETLGSATVICSDKTGTLTLNQMTVRAVWVAGRDYSVEGEGYSPTGRVLDDAGATATRDLLDPLLPLVMCNDSHLDGAGGIVGDPTEAALVVVAAKIGLDTEAIREQSPRLGEVPFDAAEKYMATFHGEGSRVRVHVKGAVDVLLDRCTSILTADGVVAMSAGHREAVLAQVTRLGGQGLRVLGAATTVADAMDPDRRAMVDGLTLTAVVGIADPPRPAARDAIALCRRAGIMVKMITGDHADTAAAIAKELGIPGEVVTGRQLDRMSEQELTARVAGIGVFARVSPEHKVAIVQALTAGDHIVAMTGDGVNDAAALRAAHIGVAMGITGTEVTKEAADMILADDDFATIVRAVREGRAIYANVVKFVRFQLSTNAGAILTFLGSTAAGLPAPLTAIQVLWVNIIMDGPPAMALGVDPARSDVMNQPPRRSGERILSGQRLGRILRAGIIMALGTLGVLTYATGRWEEGVALTMAFTTFVFFQLFNVFNARVEDQSVFSRYLFTNRPLWISLTVVAVLQVAAVQVPFMQPVFDTEAMTATQWLLCIAVSASILVVEETIKLVRRALRRPAGDRVVSGGVDTVAG